MDFEEVLNVVGSYGKYQRLLIYLYLGPVCSTAVILTMASAFLVQTPPHWCNVPQLKHLSPADQRNLISPKVTKHGLETFDNCLMFDLNYTQVVNNLTLGSTLEYRNLHLEGKVQTRECDQGWTFDKTFVDNSAAITYNLVCEKESETAYILTLSGIGRIIGTPIICYISDNFGRKTAFLTCLTLAVSSWLSPIFNTSYIVFAIFRFLNGMALPAIVKIPHILVTEMVGMKERSQVSLVVYTHWMLGMILLSGFASIVQDWQKLALICATIGVTNYAYVFFLPESPMWLISRKRFDEAHSILESIAKLNKRTIAKDLLDKLKEIHTGLDSEVSNRIATSQLFTNKSILSSLTLLSCLWIVSDFSYYTTLLNFDNLSGNPYANFALLSVVELPSVLIGWSLIDTRLGRRLTVTFMLFLSGSSYFISLTFPPNLSMYTTIFIMVGRCCSISGYIAMYQVLTECLPTPLRSRGIAFCSVASSSLHFVVPHVAMLGRTSVKIPLLITGVCMYVGVCIASLLPETFNVKLPQTVDDCNNLWKSRKYLSFAKPKIVQNSSEHALETVS